MERVMAASEYRAWKSLTLWRQNARDSAL